MDKVFSIFQYAFCQSLYIFSLEKYRQYTLWTLLLDEIYVGSIS